MRTEYIEGTRATENFEEGMKSPFQVPKDAVVKTEEPKTKNRVSETQSERKPRLSDKD